MKGPVILARPPAVTGGRAQVADAVTDQQLGGAGDVEEVVESPDSLFLRHGWDGEVTALALQQ